MVAVVHAMNEAVDATVDNFGETVTYTYHATGKSKTFRAGRVRLRQDELVGDFKQGDCRFVIRPEDIGVAPAKYDKILGADGFTYGLVAYLAVDKRLNGTLIAYTPIGRA